MAVLLLGQHHQELREDLHDDAQGRSQHQRHIGVHSNIPGLLAPHPHCETIHRSWDAERRSRREVEVEAGESVRSICQGRHVSERAEEKTVSMKTGLRV
jgi:hypothetical protein